MLMYTHFSDGKKYIKIQLYLFYFLTLKYVKILLLKRSLVPNKDYFFKKKIRRSNRTDVNCIPILVMEKIYKKIQIYLFYFLRLKYIKVHFKSSLVPNKDCIFLKYFFDDPTLQM